VEGASSEINAFGMPMGPFELLDRIGLDVAHHVSRVLLDAFGERLPAPRALESLISAGRTGAKGRSGFYRYGPDGPSRGADPEASRIAGAPRRARRGGQLSDRSAGRLTQVQERLLLQMINEAALALGDGIPRSPLDVDLAMVLGTGFPPFRGGLLRFADSVGSANLVERLEILAGRHGPRFEPSGYLVGLAKTGRGFHPA